MKYRAIAIDLRVNERPVQIYGGELKTIRTWAEEIADRHKVNVAIYLTEERLLDTVSPPEEKKRDA